MKNSSYLMRLSWVLLLAGTMAACGNDDDGPAPPTRTELLTGKAQWNFAAIESDPPYPEGGTLVRDVYAQLPNCFRDNFYRFQENGRFTLENGPTKCNDSDPQILNQGSWTFNADETALSLSGNSASFEWKIVELTEAALVIQQEFTEDNIRYTWTFSFN